MTKCRSDEPTKAYLLDANFGAYMRLMNNPRPMWRALQAVPDRDPLWGS